jgi:hypothetical protein
MVGLHTIHLNSIALIYKCIANLQTILGKFLWKNVCHFIQQAEQLPFVTAGLTVHVAEGSEEYVERAADLVNGRGPLRWMPPEAIMHGRWSHKSDGKLMVYACTANNEECIQVLNRKQCCTTLLC